MAEPVNLNKFRKAKKRLETQQQATENRIKYGRTKAEKQRDALEKSKLESRLSKREPDS